MVREDLLERITLELSSDFFLEAISYGVLRHDLDPSCASTKKPDLADGVAVRTARRSAADGRRPTEGVPTLGHVRGRDPTAASYRTAMTPKTLGGMK